MTRKSRKEILQDGCFAHIFSRSIEKRYIFKTDCDFNEFQNLLLHFKKKYPFQIHHYCLMHTHFHIAVSMPDTCLFSKALQELKWRYTRSFNKRHKRRGPLWQERFKSLLIEDAQYLYACGIYIEGNPLKAGLVDRSEDWNYSSASVYTSGEDNPLVDRYELPSLPEGINWEERFFTKGTGIGSSLFKIYQREECQMWMPVP